MNIKQKGFIQHHFLGAKSRAGFTIIELLVVIAIIGLISSVVLVSMRGSTGKAKIAKGLEFSQTIMNTIGHDAVAVWNFDEGSGGIAHDKSGYGNNLSLVGGTWVEGVMENSSAYRFRSGSTITIFPRAIGLGVTYEFWFKLPNTSDTTGTFFCAEDVTNITLEDNLGQTSYGDNTCGTDYRTSELNISDTKWHHFAFSKSSDSQLCLDGQCKSMGDATGNIPNIKRVNFNNGCGCGYGTFTQGLIIDNLRIYERALGSAEIQQHYAGGAEKHEIALK